MARTQQLARVRQVRTAKEFKKRPPSNPLIQGLEMTFFRDTK
jgi:hypothetical protein